MPDWEFFLFKFDTNLMQERPHLSEAEPLSFRRCGNEAAPREETLTFRLDFVSGDSSRLPERLPRSVHRRMLRSAWWSKAPVTCLLIAQSASALSCSSTVDSSLFFRT